MVGSKYSEEQREQALGMVAGGFSAAKTGRLLGIPASTVSDWVRRASEDDEDFQAARREERAKMVNRAFKIVGKGMHGIEKQVTASVREKSEIDKVILRILTSPEIDEATAKMMAKIVREYSGVSLGDLTRATKTALDIHDQLESGMQEGDGQAVLVEFENGAKELSE